MTTTAAQQPIRITVQHPSVAADVAWIGDAALRREAEVLGHERRTAGIFARDASGRIVAGITAFQTGTDFYIQYAWVGLDLRGIGLGRALMLAAEHAAYRRGAARLYLNTMTFQAPDFYSKLGYTEEGRLPDFTLGHDRHYYRKGVEAHALPTLPAGLTLDITDAPSEADIKIVDDGLTEHWKTVGPEHTDLAAQALAPVGTVVGGVTGVTDAYAFTIIHAHVKEGFRGQGIGRRLVEALEQTALAHGCRHATVYPFDWQAPGFWSRLGYATLFRVEDFVMGQGRQWVRKHLTTERGQS